MRQFDLKAEAEMRLRSDEFAAELARQRCTSPAVDESSAPGHVSADARGSATATEAVAGH